MRKTNECSYFIVDTLIQKEANTIDWSPQEEQTRDVSWSMTPVLWVHWSLEIHIISKYSKTSRSVRFKYNRTYKTIVFQLELAIIFILLYTITLCDSKTFYKQKIKQSCKRPS